jgi:hypothetical protein
MRPVRSKLLRPHAGLLALALDVGDMRGGVGDLFVEFDLEVISLWPSKLYGSLIQAPEHRQVPGALILIFFLRADPDGVLGTIAKTTG